MPKKKVNQSISQSVNPCSHLRAGFALVELIVAIGVFSTIVFATIRLFLVSQETAIIGEKKTQAQALSSEYLEGLRNLKRNDWDSLTNGRYIFQTQIGNLNLVATTSGEMINNFTRYLEIGDAFRDQTGRLVTTGGNLDPSTKKVSTLINWGGLHPGSVAQTTYLTRYLENIAWTQTTVAEFEQGEMELVKIVDPVIDDGELQLKGGCVSGAPESLIYDDQLQNGWRSGCQDLNCRWWEWWCWFEYWSCQILQYFNHVEINLEATDYTWDDSQYSFKMTFDPTGWAWARVYNSNEVCTKGFRNLHFYAYNPGAEEVELYVTAYYQQWETAQITVPPHQWQEINIEYEQLEDYENSLQSLYFHKNLSGGDPAVIVYLDQIELTGGVGGYFTQGTLTSSVLDADHSSAFNRISFDGQIPDQTEIGFQTAIANTSNGPWVFAGPGGTGLADDLYTSPEGEGIWLGNNIGQFFRYKAYLKSLDGENTPILEEVTVNYSP